MGPAIEAPFPWLAMNRFPGGLLYVVFMGMLGVAAVWTTIREKRRSEWLERQASERHREIIAFLNGIKREQTAGESVLRALEAKGVAQTNPQYQKQAERLDVYQNILKYFAASQPMTFHQGKLRITTDSDAP